VATALVALEADCEAQDSAGYRPLHMAAGNGREEVVRALISCGADKEAQARSPPLWGVFGSAGVPTRPAGYAPETGSRADSGLPPALPHGSSTRSHRRLTEGGRSTWRRASGNSRR
jgi:ankyrin repeat protein